MSLPSATTAARNNAKWCDTVCTTHGNPGVFGPDAWTAPRRPPRRYPDAVVLDPAADPHDVLRRVDAAAGCSVKDSFATLDLAPAGFRVLFEAEWIGLEGTPAPAGRAAPWRRVRDARELDAWASAWGGTSEASPFRPELLDEPGVAVVAGHDGARVVAGAVLNRAAGVVGVTNLFTTNGALDAAWDSALVTARSLFPNPAIVGYESGADLGAARRHGFRPLGRLRVWIKDA